jgi:hypothetical protein
MGIVGAVGEGRSRSSMTVMEGEDGTEEEEDSGG